MKKLEKNQSEHEENLTCTFDRALSVAYVLSLFPSVSFFSSGKLSFLKTLRILEFFLVEYDIYSTIFKVLSELNDNKRQPLIMVGVKISQYICEND